MESNDRNDSATALDQDDGDADTLARVVVGVVILPLLLLATYFISQLPYEVTSYRQLGHYAGGKRVQFICEYQGQIGTFGRLDYEGHPILLESRSDEREWTPKAGESCEVTGVLKHFAGTLTEIDATVDFMIADAQLRPTN